MADKIKVLIVDDEDQFRKTTKKLLEKRGFQTILAENGYEAIEKAKEKPDAVVLDIKMPGMDGQEVLKEIKKISSELPVIMLTGHGGLDSAQESLGDGAFDYLLKPCDINLLTSKIKEAVKLGSKETHQQESSVEDVMIPIEEYTTVYAGESVKEAIVRLKNSFLLKMATNKIMETGHRSILVLNKKNEVKGILSITDLLKAMMPAYLNSPKPSMADSIQFSPMFWRGMFSKAVQLLVNVKVEELMSEAPFVVKNDSNLMEAAYMMITNQIRRLLVKKGDEVVGVIREQDLFFEIERIQRHM